MNHVARQEATTTARYDVYVVNHLQDSFQDLTLGDLPEPICSVVLDQARQLTSDVDADGFAAVSEFEVSGLGIDDLASVVVRVSAQPDEAGFAALALLLADAVKLEAVE